MIYIYIFMAAMSIFISGCSGQKALINADSSLLNSSSQSSILHDKQNLSINNLLYEMSDWDFFSIKSPISFKRHILRDDGSVALTTYDTSTTDRTPGDMSVHLYSKVINCSSQIIAMSNPILLSNGDGDTKWGIVDIWDNKNQEGGELPENSDQIICRKEGTPLPKSIYSLCSEKNGKTVVICLDQMTDNPELAKQIFETFKWTDK